MADSVRGAAEYVTKIFKVRAANINDDNRCDHNNKDHTYMSPSSDLGRKDAIRARKTVVTRVGGQRDILPLFSMYLLYFGEKCDLQRGCKPERLCPSNSSNIDSDSTVATIT